MAKRFYVEPRASEDYPWQLVDIDAGLRLGQSAFTRQKRKLKQPDMN